MGLKYDQYMDGYARHKYLNLLAYATRAKFTIVGHHIWDCAAGLGADTIFIDWKNADGEPYFMSGHWIVYGFRHRYSALQGWYTDIYGYKLPHDSAATPKPNLA